MNLKERAHKIWVRISANDGFFHQDYFEQCIVDEFTNLEAERNDLEEHWADEVGEKQALLRRYAEVIQENEALRDELYEKTGKAFWEGHMRGRIYG